ncbi:MAG: hypothetical protein HY674_22715 [Chloroflexi bacterium]|nr:hypothetical protein [Chloroflexota bacterium]
METERKEMLLRELAEKLVQRGLVDADSPGQRTVIDNFRQLPEDQIRTFIKALERRIAGQAGCGCGRHWDDAQPILDGAQPILTITTDKLKCEGYATPLATLQTAAWTGLKDDADAYLDCFAPEMQEEFQKARARQTEKAKSSIASQACRCRESSGRLHGIRVWAQHAVSGDEVKLEYELLIIGEERRICMQPFRRVGDVWKISGPPQEAR